MNRGALVALVALAGLAVACSRQDAAWRHAEAAGTEAAYASYLETYPDGLNAGEARRRLGALREAREWSRAERLGTPESYQRYLARHPEGDRAQVARERLAVFLEPLAAPTQLEPGPATGPEAMRAMTDPAATPPVDADAGASAPSPDPGAPASPGPDHWLQLGAFVGGEAAAEAAWQRLSAEHQDALLGLGHRIIRAPLDSGDLWRLFAGPLAAGEGEARCGMLRLAGASCLLRAQAQVMNHVTK